MKTKTLRHSKKNNNISWTKKYRGEHKLLSSKMILRNFENEISVYFFEMLLMIKLFHWKTYSYSIHKASDNIYSKINEHMDRFIEVLLGKSGVRIDLSHKKSISLIDVNKNTQFISKINNFKSYLVNLSSHKAMKLMANMDLFTIRDELLADLNQFLYLLSLQ